MLSYALLKGARLGYLDAKHGAAGKRAYAGMLKEFIEVDAGGRGEHPPRVPGRRAGRRSREGERIATAPTSTTSPRRSAATTPRRWAPSSSPASRWSVDEEVIQVLTWLREWSYHSREFWHFSLPRRIGMSQRMTSVFRAILACAGRGGRGGRRRPGLPRQHRGHDHRLLGRRAAAGPRWWSPTRARRWRPPS